MTGATAELGLATATDTDDIEVYNVTNLAAALVLLDGLFSASGGHDHSAAHRGKPIPASGLAQPLSLTSPLLSSPLLTSPSLTSPAMTTATVTSGGLTVTAGGLTVTAGNVGIGTAPTSIRALLVGGTITAAAANAVGIESSVSLVASANNDNLFGINVNVSNASPNAKTGVTATGINVQSPTGANASNYGVFINAPSGATTDNFSLVARGDVALGGGGAGLATNATTGFVYLPTCNGTPTGIPTGGINASNGMRALVFDASAQKLWVYATGIGWKGVVLS